MELLKILINEFDSYDDCVAVIAKETGDYPSAYPEGAEIWTTLETAEKQKKTGTDTRIFYAETFTDTKAVILYELIID